MGLARLEAHLAVTHTQDIDSALVHDSEEFKEVHSQKTEGCQRDFVVRVVGIQELHWSMTFVGYQSIALTSHRSNASI